MHLGRFYRNFNLILIRIAVDPIFPPPPLDDWPNSKKHMSPDNLLDNNKFELVFDELVDG